jgi:hypothetical protein
MKRYWNLLGMTLAIILCIGTFYTKLALSDSRLPSFVLDTQFGNKKAVGDFVISGEYTSEKISSTLRIEKNGSHLINQKSLFSQITNSLQPLDLQNLQQNYRNFMRGKRGTLSNFYVDQNKVIYAEIESSGQNRVAPIDFTLSVGVLDKNGLSHPSTSFSLPIYSNAVFMNVSDVQLEGDQLKIVTYNSKDNGDQEVHLYSIDVGKQKLEGDSKLFSVPGVTNDTGNAPSLQVVTESDKTQPNNLIAILVNTSKTYHPKFYVVNLLSGNKTELSLPKGFAQSSNSESQNEETIYLTGTKLEFLKATEQGLTLVSYDMMTKKQGQPIKISFLNKEKQLPMTCIKNDKFYVMTQFEPAKDHFLIVKDLNTGKTLYKGKIKVEKGKLNSGQDSLRLDGIDIR